MSEYMITCTTWVPRGVAAQNPRRVEMDEKEFERISQLAKLQLEDAREGLGGADTNKGGDGTDKKVEEDDEMEIEEMEKLVGKKEDDNDLKEYNLEDYDAPTEEERQTGICKFA
jgi:periodic tryptophan protein 1